MRYILKFSLLSILFSAVAFISCNDDDGFSLNEFRIGFGTIVAGQGNSYRILLDNGSELTVIANRVPWVVVANGQRVIANFTILGTANQEGGFLVRLNALTRVLTKPYLLQSFINEDSEQREDSIGNDPVNVLDAFFGGGFLNIRSRFASTNGTHMFNLIYDDVMSDGSVEHGDTAYLVFRHNEFNGTRLRWRTFFSSFPIQSLVVPPATERPVKISWKDYDDRIYSLRGTFRFGENPSPSEAFFEDADDSGYFPMTTIM